MNARGYIVSGALHLPSNGIIFDLKDRLEKIPGVTIRVATFKEYKVIAEEARALPASTKVFQVGHSLGASCAPQWARLAARPISVIYGFDPADNPFANATEYRLSLVPKNVSMAVAIISTVPGLGGGKYEAESKAHTTIDNRTVPYGHGSVEEWIEAHVELEEYARRLVGA